MSRRSGRSANVNIKYLIEGNIVYPIVKIRTANGWNIEAFMDHVIKKRGWYVNFKESLWDIAESIGREYRKTYKEYNRFDEYQFDKKSLYLNNGSVSYIDKSDKINKKLLIEYSGMEGIIPIKRYELKVDMAVFKNKEVRKYVSIEDPISDYLEFNLYDYIQVDYNWKSNHIEVTIYNAFEGEKTQLSEGNFRDQCQGVERAYEIYEEYKYDNPELMVEMLI